MKLANGLELPRFLVCTEINKLAKKDGMNLLKQRLFVDGCEPIMKLDLRLQAGNIPLLVRY